MKKMCFALCMLLIGGITASAQCDKNVKLTSARTEYLDGEMNVQRTVDEKTVIDVTDSTIKIAPGNEDHVLNGNIQSATCNWPVPYKVGKSILKAKINTGNRELNAIITIEGKDGQLTFLFEAAEMPDQKIRVALDSFNEK